MKHHANLYHASNLSFDLLNTVEGGDFFPPTFPYKAEVALY